MTRAAAVLAVGWTLATVLAPLLHDAGQIGSPTGERPFQAETLIAPAVLACLAVAGLLLLRGGRTRLGAVLTGLPALGCALTLLAPLLVPLVMLFYR